MDGPFTPLSIASLCIPPTSQQQTLLEPRGRELISPCLGLFCCLKHNSLASTFYRSVVQRVSSAEQRKEVRPGAWEPGALGSAPFGLCAEQVRGAGDLMLGKQPSPND